MGGKPLSPHKASPAELHAQGGVEGAARLLQAVVVVEFSVGQIATFHGQTEAAAGEVVGGSEIVGKLFGTISLLSFEPRFSA